MARTAMLPFRRLPAALAARAGDRRRPHIAPPCLPEEPGLAEGSDGFDLRLDPEPDPAERPALVDRDHRQCEKCRLTPGWRKRLGDPISMEMEELRRVRARLWARSAIRWPPPCGCEPEMRVARGWIPARAAHGRAAAWFFSRGC